MKHWTHLTAVFPGSLLSASAGDAVSIAYRRDRSTLLGHQITHIVGEGSLQKETKDE